MARVKPTTGEKDIIIYIHVYGKKEAQGVVSWYPGSVPKYAINFTFFFQNTYCIFV